MKGFWEEGFLAQIAGSKRPILDRVKRTSGTNLFPANEKLIHYFIYFIPLKKIHFAVGISL